MILNTKMCLLLCLHVLCNVCICKNILAKIKNSHPISVPTLLPTEMAQVSQVICQNKEQGLFLLTEQCLK